MSKYLITAKTFEGGITLAFNEQGWITHLAIEAQLGLAQQQWFMQRLPLTEPDMDYFRKIKQLQVTEIVDEITFEDFYIRFSNRVGKAKAERAWNTLPRAEQIKAYQFIQRYLQDVKSRCIAQLYPATYLNQRRWND